MPRKPTHKFPVDTATIGRRLREIRKRRGMTQVELAPKLRMKQALLSSYELGVLRLHGGLIVAFAKAVSVSADELLGSRLKEPKVDVLADRHFVRRLHEIERLSNSNRQALLKTIDAFLRGVAA